MRQAEWGITGCDLNALFDYELESLRNHGGAKVAEEYYHIFCNTDIVKSEFTKSVATVFYAVMVQLRAEEEAR